MRIIHNPENCIGCRACMTACKDANGLPPGVLLLRIFTQENQGDSMPTVRQSLSRCHQCGSPACVKACPVRAIRKQADGVVIIERDRCIACGQCASACPFHAIARSQTGLPYKCALCTGNAAYDGTPACIVACPYGCIQIRDDHSR